MKKKIIKSSLPVPLAGSSVISINMPLNMNFNAIIQVTEGTQNFEGITNQNVTEITNTVITGGTGGISKFILLEGTQPGQPVTGNLVFNGTTTVSDTGIATNPKDAVPLGQLKTEIATKTGDYLPLKGGTMDGDLNMNSQNITAILGTNDENSAPNLSQIQTYLTNNLNSYIPLVGNSSANPLTGPLIFDNTQTAKTSSVPIQTQDAVNKKFMNSSISNKLKDFLPLTGGTMIGNMNMGSEFITNIATAAITDISSAVPLSQVISTTTSEMTKYLPKSGGGVSSFNLNNHKFTDVNDPVNGTDLVNLQSMNFETDKYLNLSGGTLTGSLSLGNTSTVNTLATPTANGDIVNKTYLDNILNNCVPLSGTTTGKFITGLVTFANGATMIGLPDPTKDTEIATLQFMNSETGKSLRDLLKDDGTPTMKISLNLGNNNISNLSNASLSNDLINKNILDNRTTSFLGDYVSRSGSNLTGPLTVNGKIIGLPNPSTDEQAVNFQTMAAKLNLYSKLNLTNTIASINMNSQTITNAGSPTAVSELVIKSVLDSQTGTLFSSSGGIITGNLTLSSTKITNLSDPTEDTEIVNKNTLDNLVKQKTDLLVPLSGNKNMTGTLNMGGKRIINITNGSSPTDAVNYGQSQTALNTAFSNRILKTGGTVSLAINANNLAITENNYTTTPTLDSSGVTKIFMTNSLSNYVSKNTVNTISGNINMSTNKITGLANPVSSSDALNLQTLNTTTANTTSSLIPLTGGTLNTALNLSSTAQITGLPTLVTPETLALSYGSLTKMINDAFSNKISRGTSNNAVLVNDNINMNNSYKVVNLSNPTNSSDAVNKQTLDNKIKAYVDTTTTNTMTGDLNMGGKRIITLADPTTPSDLINLYAVGSTANTSLTNYVLRDGSRSMTGDINLGDQSVQNLKTPTSQTSSSATTIKAVRAAANTYLPLSGGTMTGVMQMGWLGQIEISGNILGSTNPVPLSKLISYELPYLIKTGIIGNHSWTANAYISWNWVSDGLLGSRNYSDFYAIENVATNINAALRIKKSGTYLIFVNIGANQSGEIGAGGRKEYQLLSSFNGTITSLRIGLNWYTGFITTIFKTPSITATDNYFLSVENLGQAKALWALSWSIVKIS